LFDGSLFDGSAYLPEPWIPASAAAASHVIVVVAARVRMDSSNVRASRFMLTGYVVDQGIDIFRH